MRKVSLNELKIGLAEFATAAAGGEVIEVTKYNRPYIRIVSAARGDYMVGDRFGRGELKPAVRTAITLGQILKVLEEDRGGG